MPGAAGVVKPEHGDGMASVRPRACCRIRFRFDGLHGYFFPGQFRRKALITSLSTRRAVSIPDLHQDERPRT